MSQPYVGQVLLVGFNFAPVDWATCNGALLSISENSTLFNLIGTTYGGDGQTTFGLPDLRGRIPIHQGSNGVSTYVMGATGGVENVTISINQFPTHTHSLLGSAAAGSSGTPTNNVLGGVSAYTTMAPSIAMNNSMIGSSGGGNLPHSNLQPFLVLNWVIALYGVYPSQS